MKSLKDWKLSKMPKWKHTQKKLLEEGLAELHVNSFCSPRFFGLVFECKRGGMIGSSISAFVKLYIFTQETWENVSFSQKSCEYFFRRNLVLHLVLYLYFVLIIDKMANLF